MTKKKPDAAPDAALELLTQHGGRRFSTILADPPWQFYSNHSQAERINGRAMSDLVAIPAK